MNLRINSHSNKTTDRGHAYRGSSRFPACTGYERVGSGPPHYVPDGGTGIPKPLQPNKPKYVHTHFIQEEWISQIRSWGIPIGSYFMGLPGPTNSGHQGRTGTLSHRSSLFLCPPHGRGARDPPSPLFMSTGQGGIEMAMERMRVRMLQSLRTTEGRSPLPAFYPHLVPIRGRGLRYPLGCTLRPRPAWISRLPKM